MTNDISRTDVQLLANRDQVAQLFYALNFDITIRPPQTVDSLDIRGDLRNDIRGIERIGSLTDETWTLEVYLFEVRSITKSVRDGLAQVFRDRPWDYLLVLTEKYEQIDFQLVERVETQAGMLQPTMDKTEKFRKGKTKPRVLSVERQNPGDVALRVLRQLRYTGDIQVIDYCEKLRSVYDVAYWSETHFNNRALFSDYYLKERLPEREEWHRSETMDLGALRMNLRQLAKLYSDAEEKLAGQTTLMVQDKMVVPVLEQLGFDMQRGASRGKPSRSGEEREADYLLHLKDSKGKRIGNAVGFCLAYAWGRDLDRKIPLAEDFDPLRDVERLNENPGAAVVALLDAGIANWAIVTNGRVWRLYTAKAHSRATNYYEIDLEEIANNKVSDSLEAFRYFWFLFRAEAFRPSQVGEISLLDLILRESEQYAHDLGEKLKERVFDSIFPQFAQGFVEYAKSRGEPELNDLDEKERDEKLKEIFDGTLTFLYRLLFLLYAESRELLPVYGTRDYYPYSLAAMKATIATKAGISEDEAARKTRNAYPDSNSTTFYDQLQILFKAVDKGDKTMNVPTYNGGLFMVTPDKDDDSAEAKVARFLHDHKIPDRYLALGLDLMARIEDDKEARLVFVDYKSLGVRQLGSIYEGLLEFKLHIALEHMTVVPTTKGKKAEKIIPWEEAKRQKISPIKVRRDGELIDKIYDPGEAYLINDRSERKATGSYYTPDFVVKYIVEHTVGEVLTQKMNALKGMFDAAQIQLKAEQNKVKGLRQRHITVTQEAEHQAYLHFKETLNEQFFDLKVLDPAMGSGHFLVEAVDYITDRMAHFLEKIGWNPVIYHLGQMRTEIQQQMEEQGIEIDADKLTDINLLKRQVLKRCIYGVDINPMAVELAKVSVWLDSFTLGAPLSFLDHHLKCGNSLLGVRVKQVREAIEDMTKQQATLFEEVSLWASVALATGGALEVARLSDATAEQVHLSKEKHRDAEKALLPYKNLLNIYTSRWFSNPPTKDRNAQKWYDHVVYFLRSKEAREWYLYPNKLAVLTAEQRTIVKNAAYDAEARRFFHWEMEFPEVFFGVVKGTKQAIELKEDAGFDAVVGNPPYGFKGSQEDRAYLSSSLVTLDKRAESYIAFIEIAHKQVKQHGFVSLIVPDTWLILDFTQKLREQFLKSTRIMWIIDLPNNVFLDATVDTTIFVTEKLSNFGTSTDFVAGQTQIIRFSANEDLLLLEGKNSAVFRQENWSLEENYRFSIDILDQERRIIEKIRAASNLLEAICTINYGLKAYQEGKGKPSQTRQDVNDKVFSTTHKLDDSYYPFFEGEDISRFLINADDSIWLKYGKHLAEPRNFDLFTGQRLLYRKIVGKTLIGTLVDNNALSNTLLYIIKSKKEQIDIKYLMCLLNSYLLGFFYKKLFSINSKETFPQIMLDDLKMMPIHRINFVTSEKDRAYYRGKAASLYEYCLGKDDEDYTCILEFARHHLTREPEESDVVHDLLAYLAEQMLELNKAKQAKQKGFLDALVQTLRIKKDKDGRTGIDALVGKQQLMEYPGDYRKERSEPLKSDELIVILRKKNRARLGISLDSPTRVAENWTYEDEIRKLHKESLVEVLPIKERLRRTDELIDEVVYQLYGLTDDEIKIVKGEN